MAATEPGTALRRAAAIALVGLATGALTQIGQGTLPDGWSQAANAISPWLLVAFVVGSRTPDRPWAAVAGIATLFLAVVGYYAMVQLRYGYGGGTGSWVFWGLAAAVGGPVFGVAGWSWRFEDGWRRAAAIGLLAASAIAEGVYLIRILPEAATGLGFIVVGALVPIVLGRSMGERGRAYVAVIPALALGALGYASFLWLSTLTASL